ncbi:hypothetical protein M758_2G237500 [Ceratodon purpureus]|nr:hypothetical protein M758_2G237500 [Ceratodon purpureus]
MDFLIGNKTLDEIYGSNNVDMKDDMKELSTVDENRGSDTVNMDEFKTLDEIYGSYNIDMNERRKSDDLDGFDLSSRRLKTLDGMMVLNIDDDDEVALDCSPMLSPGTEVSACITNDGSCIPLRKLGSLEVPAIITGMWQVAGRHGDIDMKKAVTDMNFYAFAGLGAFDMADTYGPAEELYGMFRQQYWGHKPVLGLTKFVPRYGNSGSDTRSEVEAVIDRSRNRMGVAILDMVQFHWWDFSDGRYCDSMKWLYTLQKEGKIKELGLTNFDTEHMIKIVENCGIPVVSNQVTYSVIDTRPEKKMVAWCLQHEVKLLAYGTLLGGFLSEKYLGQPEPERTDLTTPSLSKYKYAIDQWGGWALFQELLRVMSEIAAKHKVSISNVAVRYIADKPVVAAVIIGARLGISQHIATNQAAYSFPGLDDGDIAMIQSIVKKGNELPGDPGDEHR